MASYILQKIAAIDIEKQRVGSGRLVGQSFLAIPGNDALRWIVPRDSRLGSNVLAQWKPYGAISLFKWCLFRFFYALKIAPLMPGTAIIMSEGLSCAQMPRLTDDTVPVIYVGTPGPQQKAVVTLVNAKNGKSVAVMKVALTAGACTSLLREAEILTFLADVGVKNVPRLLSIDKVNGLSWQSVLPGLLSPKKLTKKHIDWLQNLPQSGGMTSFEEQKKLMCKLVSHNDFKLSAQQVSLLKIAIEKIKSNNPIPLVLVHGDFAPWNLKQNSNGDLAVFDWEDAKIEGLPLWDLCHFYFIQAHLLNSKMTIDKFSSNPLVKTYLVKMGIDRADMLGLMLLYFLFMVVDRSRNTSRAYRAFLIEQVQQVVAY